MTGNPWRRTSSARLVCVTFNARCKDWTRWPRRLIVPGSARSRPVRCKYRTGAHSLIKNRDIEYSAVLVELVVLSGGYVLQAAVDL